MPASTSYDSTTLDVASGNINLASDSLYVMLVSGYVPNPKTHAKRSDVTGEISGTGYTAGGQAVAGVVATEDTTNDKTLLTATNPVWSASTLSATGCVVYKHRGGAASADNLVSYVDFGGTITSTAAPFTVTSFATLGFLSVNRV
jgi:hypothetical protein